MDMETQLHTTPREILICVDSSKDGVINGRFFFPDNKPEAFSCLSQCLLRIDALLDDKGQPQAFTEPRTFRQLQTPDYMSATDVNLPQGNLATFHLQILYRRNSSWQGRLVWMEQDQAQSFRSVLELMTLIESGIQG